MLLYERYTSQNRTEIASLSYEQGELVYQIRVSDSENILGSHSFHCADDYFITNVEFKHIKMSFNVADLITCMKATKAFSQLKGFQISMDTEEDSAEDFRFETSILCVSNKPEVFLLYGLMYGSYCGTEVESTFNLSGVFQLDFTKEKTIFEQGIEALELLVATDSDIEQQSVFGKQIGMTVNSKTGTQFLVTQTNNMVLDDGTGKASLSKSYVVQNIATGIEAVIDAADFNLI